MPIAELDTWLAGMDGQGRDDATKLKNVEVELQVLLLGVGHFMCMTAHERVFGTDLHRPMVSLRITMCRTDSCIMQIATMEMF